MSMEKMLRELTDQLYKYNAWLGNKVLKPEDIEEEEDNLKDVLKEQQELKELLAYLKNASIGDNWENDTDNLMKLHTLLNGFSWYFQNIHKILMDIFKNYPHGAND